MHTEFTDNKIGDLAGWIIFDAECRFCVAHRCRCGRIFERRSFVWLPLQTPGAAERLGVPKPQLRAEMWLQLADGRKFSGVNAWSVQMRYVWWLWPLGVLLAVPGVNGAARILYGWISAGVCPQCHSADAPSHRRNPKPAMNLALILKLSALPRFIRQLFWVYYAFIGLSLVCFGFGTFLFADQLAAGTPLARAVCGFLALFWTLRFVAGTFVFDLRPYLTNRWRRAGLAAANLVFTSLPIVYGWIALKGVK